MSRGRVDVFLNYDKTSDVAYELNKPLISGYIKALKELKEEFDLEGEPDMNYIARLPNALQTKKDDLSEDFADSPDITMSGLYKTIYSAEYGVFGGEAYGAIIGNYDFSPGTADMSLLQNIAGVSAMAHAPFFGAVSTEFFPNMDGDFTSLPNLKDLDGIFEGLQYAKRRGFRESEDARYVGLTLPRFLLFSCTSIIRGWLPGAISPSSH